MMPYDMVKSIVDRATLEGVEKIDIEASAAQDELRHCETKIALSPTYGRPNGSWNQICKFRGEWWAVGQTSLFDDVATGLFAVRQEDQTQTVSNFLRSTQYGVRLHRWNQPSKYGDDEVVGDLSFITHMTDG